MNEQKGGIVTDINNSLFSSRDYPEAEISENSSGV